MSQDWYKFRDEVRCAKDSLPNPDKVWYRGHTSVCYQLIPSLYRYKSGVKKEQELFADFVEGGGRKFVRHVFNESDELDLDQDWMTLFDMQHYGVPTRLLDWTGTFATAVAFALLDREETNNDPAAVFVLDPLSLNQKAHEGLIEIRKDGYYKYKNYYWKGPRPESPVAIQTP